MQHFAGKTGRWHKNTQNLNVTQQMVQTAVRLAAATKAEVVEEKADEPEDVDMGGLFGDDDDY